MRAVARAVVLMLLVVLVTTSPAGAATTVFFGGYAVSVPRPLALLVSGFAPLGVAALMLRKWRL